MDKWQKLVKEMFPDRRMHTMPRAPAPAAALKVEGLPRLKPEERGLIVSTDLTVGDGSIHHHKSNPRIYRVAALFWDKIVMPHGNPIVYFAPPPDFAFLAEEGIAYEPRVSFTGASYDWRAVRDQYLETLKEGERTAPGQWALFRGEDGLKILGEKPGESDILFRLHKALPVPDHEVPLQEVLGFKARRADELQALRHGLHGIYRSIADDPNRDLREQLEFDQLARALTDFTAVSEEWKQPKRFISISSKIGRSTVTGALAGNGAAVALGLPGELGALAGAAFAQVALDVGAVFKRRSAPAPYEYVSRYHDEVFL